MKRLLLGTLCAVALGCNSNTPPTSPTNPTREQATTQSLDETKTTQLPEADRNRRNDGSSPAVDPDNTEVNARDRDNLAKTPFNQNENQKDIDITADIRRRVVDTEMSVNAQNVKIITQDGKVTLRGPVQSADEKSQIEKLAQLVAGTGNVVNQLDVQP